MNDQLFGTKFEVSGSGPPLVLIHGVGLDSSIWDASLPWLEPHFSVIRYDLAGHGKTPPIGPQVESNDFVNQLRDLLDRLGIERAHLLGFSLGGVIGRVWAARYPERTDRLAILCSVATRDPNQRRTAVARLETLEKGGAASVVGSALERWFTPAFVAASLDVLDRIRAVLLANDPVGYLASFRYFATCDELLDGLGPQIECPTFVVTGEDDSGSTPEVTVRIAAGIRDARSFILPGLRHMAVVESPQTTLEPIVAFLRAKCSDAPFRLPNTQIEKAP